MAQQKEKDDKRQQDIKGYSVPHGETFREKGTDCVQKHVVNRRVNIGCLIPDGDFVMKLAGGGD